MRPYVSDLLGHLEDLYEIVVFTMADGMNSREVLRHLDPEDIIFKNCLIVYGKMVKKVSNAANMETFFPELDKVVCIIDDRADVWEDANTSFM